jgi:hypothetical protein
MIYSMYAIYLIFYVMSAALSSNGYYILSAILLCISAVGLYIRRYRIHRNIIDLQGVFSLFWIGGQGISCLKLSYLQVDWSVQTWVCFFLVYMGFCIVCELYEKYLGNNTKYLNRNNANKFSEKKLLTSIIILTAISAICFIAEALILGFIPLFSSEPHAYSYFHISGVHYFTVSCILVPCLSVLFLMSNKKHLISKADKSILIISNILAFIIPILCVSRFQLMAMVILTLFTFISALGEISRKLLIRILLGTVCLLLPLYIGLTVARNHDVEYLNGIFEMKNANMPIFITQPYMYIANNYDNFNCLVVQLTEHTYGLRMLFPVWAFSGLKFIKPELVNFPIYVTKTELTTVTLIYDAYYDFGVIGVFIFGIFCGVFGVVVSALRKLHYNPVAHVLYAQTAMYFILSFFTTWFSNPTTWFWYGVTLIIFIFCKSKNLSEK